MLHSCLSVCRPSEHNINGNLTPIKHGSLAFQAVFSLSIITTDVVRRGVATRAQAARFFSHRLINPCRLPFLRHWQYGNQANLTAIAFVDCRQEKCTAALIKQHRHRQWRTRQLNLYSGDQNQ